MEVILKVFIIGSLVICINSLSIRDFSSDELKDDEPDYKEYAAVARYVVHKSEWASIATVSTSKSIPGFPMVNIKSVADSARDEPSTGVIYFYLTNLDFTGQDLLKSNKLTAMFTDDQDLSCTKRNVDPMEPTCARVMISGSAVKLDVNSDEYKFANRAFLSRHPAAKNWIAEHSFYLCKLDILQIVIIDFYGGANYVTPEDYYNVNKTSNGFLDHQISTNTMQLRDDNDINATADTRKHDEKIRINIKKGDESVFIEL